MKKRIIPAAILAATLALAGCSNDDLRDPNSIDQAGTPILLADLGVASGGSDGTLAARYAIDANTASPWTGSQDQVVVHGISRSDAAVNVWNTYTATVATDGTVVWKQDAVNAQAGNTYLAVETVSRITQIESWGGSATGNNHPGNADLPGLDQTTEENYRKADYLSTPSDFSVAISKGIYTLSDITLHHQRTNFVVAVTDGDDNNSLADNAVLHVITTNGDTYQTYRTAKQGKVTTFRVILPAGCTIQSATLYSEDNTDAGSKQKTITFGNAPASLESGKRYTASVIYYDYKKLDASITLGNWTAGNGDGEDLNTGNP